MTDAPEHIDGLPRFAASFGNIERVDVLPFHQLGKSKWHELGLDYKLENVRPPSREVLERATAIFKRHGLDAC